MVSSKPGAWKKTYAIYKPKGVLSAASDDALPRRPTLTDLMHAAGTLTHARLTHMRACACFARRRAHAHSRLLRPPALASFLPALPDRVVVRTWCLLRHQMVTQGWNPCADTSGVWT